MRIFSRLNEDILGLLSLFGGMGVPRRPGEPDVLDQRNTWNAAFEASNQQSLVTGTSVYPRLPRETLNTLIEDMDAQGLASAVVDMHAADTCAHDPETGAIFLFEGENNVVELTKEMFKAVQADDKIYGWVRGMLLYGSEFVRLLYSDREGVTGTVQTVIRDMTIVMDPLTKRLQGYKEKGHLFRVTDANKDGSPVSYPWDYLHFCRLVGTNHRYTPYGKSLLADAVRSWMQVTMAEDAALLARMQRQDRTAWYIDVGDAPVAVAHDIVQDVKNKFRRKQVLDPTLQRLKHEYNSLTSTDDVFLGTRPESSTRADVLSAGNLPAMEDINYFLQRFANNTKTPPAALGIPDTAVGADPWKANRSAVSQNIAYARTVMAHQRDACIALFRMAEIHARLKEPDVESMKFRLNGENGSKPFKVKMQAPRMIEQLERVEAEVMQMNLAAEAIGLTNVSNGTVDAYENTLWVYKHILHMPDEQIRKIVTKPPAPETLEGPGSQGGKLKPAPLEPRKGIKKRVPQHGAKSAPRRGPTIREFYEDNGVPDLDDARILAVVSAIQKNPKVLSAVANLKEIQSIRRGEDVEDPYQADAD